MKLESSELYRSRRSPVLSTRGMVAASQPLAAQAGASILERGGNAADAAVAVAAALQVTQPCSTGLGGDCFLLYYSASERKVKALNGSGRSPRALSLERARRLGFSGRIPSRHALTVTVPGAPAAWDETLERLGRLSRAEVLAPAIRLAEEGYPVAPLTARWWEESAEETLRHHRFGGELLVDGRSPRPGEVVRLPALASSLRALAEEGSRAFYTGRIAGAVVEAVREAGGLLAAEDLAGHRSEWVEPLRLSYRGVDVWECPPNGQGLAVLLALNVLRFLDADRFRRFPPESAGRLHLLVECMRLAFADALRHVADPQHVRVPVEELLSEEYGRRRAGLIREDSAMAVPGPGLAAAAGGDTVYFCTADAEGNACSCINSNFLGFGTGIVPRGCGFSLQNRGHGFTLERGHPNSLAGGKRPYHTIIPGLSTESGSGRLHAAFGVMGGMMQAQGHLQVVSALVDDELDPQAALDRGRFQIEEGLPEGVLLVEDALRPGTVPALEAKGHRVRVVAGIERPIFGLGQIVLRDAAGVLWGASDPRGDGCALGLC